MFAILQHEPWVTRYYIHARCPKFNEAGVFGLHLFFLRNKILHAGLWIPVSVQGIH